MSVSCRSQMLLDNAPLYADHFAVAAKSARLPSDSDLDGRLRHTHETGRPASNCQLMTGDNFAHASLEMSACRTFQGNADSNMHCKPNHSLPMKTTITETMGASQYTMVDGKPGVTMDTRFGTSLSNCEGGGGPQRPRVHYRNWGIELRMPYTQHINSRGIIPEELNNVLRGRGSNPTSGYSEYNFRYVHPWDNIPSDSSQNILFQPQVKRIPSPCKANNPSPNTEQSLGKPVRPKIETSSPSKQNHVIPNNELQYNAPSPVDFSKPSRDCGQGTSVTKLENDDEPECTQEFGPISPISSQDQAASAPQPLLYCPISKDVIKHQIRIRHSASVPPTNPPDCSLVTDVRSMSADSYLNKHDTVAAGMHHRQLEHHNSSLCWAQGKHADAETSFSNFAWPYSAFQASDKRDSDLRLTTETRPDRSGVNNFSSTSGSKLMNVWASSFNFMYSQSPAQRCVVCREVANGNFFGAVVCLPCKSFFIRCTKDGEPCILQQCNGECDVKKQLRNRCQYCRYQRCLAVGMSRKEKPECIHPQDGQELCKVCGDLANGIHFGVYTCEGCKKFFRRGLKEHTSYVCKDNQNCRVNPRNRNNCRYCRFQKCVSVGMSRDAIKMGRPRKLYTSRKMEELISSIRTCTNFGPKTDASTSNTGAPFVFHREVYTVPVRKSGSPNSAHMIGSNTRVLPNSHHKFNMVKQPNNQTMQQSHLSHIQDGSYAQPQRVEYDSSVQCRTSGQRPSMAFREMANPIGMRNPNSTSSLHHGISSGGDLKLCHRHTERRVPDQSILKNYTTSDSCTSTFGVSKYRGHEQILLQNSVPGHQGVDLKFRAGTQAPCDAALIFQRGNNPYHTTENVPLEDRGCTLLTSDPNSQHQQGHLTKTSCIERDHDNFSHYNFPQSSSGPFSGLPSQIPKMPPLVQMAPTVSSYTSPVTQALCHDSSVTQALCHDNSITRSVHDSIPKAEKSNHPPSQHLLPGTTGSFNTGIKRGSKRIHEDSNVSKDTPSSKCPKQESLALDLRIGTKMEHFKSHCTDGKRFLQSSNIVENGNVNSHKIFQSSSFQGHFPATTASYPAHELIRPQWNQNDQTDCASINSSNHTPHVTQYTEGAMPVSKLSLALTCRQAPSNDCAPGEFKPAKTDATAPQCFSAKKMPEIPRQNIARRFTQKTTSTRRYSVPYCPPNITPPNSSLTLRTPENGLCQLTHEGKRAVSVESYLPRPVAESSYNPSSKLPATFVGISPTSADSPSLQTSEDMPKRPSSSRPSSTAGPTPLDQPPEGSETEDNVFNTVNVHSPSKPVEGYFNPYTNEQILVYINEMFQTADSYIDDVNRPLDDKSSKELSVLDSLFSKVYGYSPLKVGQFWTNLYSSVYQRSPEQRETSPESMMTRARWLDGITSSYREKVDWCDEDLHPPTVNTNEREVWPTRGEDGDHWKHFQERVARQTYAEAQFVLRLPDIDKFHPKDWAKLGSNIRLFGNMILMASRDWFDPVRKKFKFFWNWKLPAEHPLSPYRNCIIKLGSRIFNLHMDETEVAILSTMNIISSENATFEDPSQLSEHTEMTMRILCHYLQTLNIDPEDRVPELMSVMPKVRLMSIWYSNLIKNMRADPNSMDKTLQDLAQMAIKGVTAVPKDEKIIHGSEEDLHKLRDHRPIIVLE